MIVYALILAFSLQNSWAAQVVEETIAIVNGEPVYLGDYESNLSNVLEDMRKATRAEPQAAQLADIRSKVLNQMLEDSLLRQEAKKKGIQVDGPLPGDQVFHGAYLKRFDAVVAMYHDQGLAPFKMLAFDTGVNVTLGLPYVRTSPDHGTGFDIAYQNKANPTSFLESLKLAKQLIFR